MNIGKLGNTDALAILREGTLGRLGCIASGWPYVVPVNYFFDGKDIYIHTLPGKKLDALRANPRVCLQIVYGTFEEVSNKETQENVLIKLYGRLPPMTPVESRMVKGMNVTIVFRIKVEEAPGMAEEW